MLDKKYNFSPIIALNICLASIAFIIVFSLPQQASASPFGEPIYRVLMDTSSGMGEITARVWNATMNVVNSLVLVLLIYIAFMNILRIQIDSYAVKKFLPTFIMTIILANFSFLIARIIIDIGNITIALFLVGNEQNALTGAFDELIDKVPIAPGKQEAGENYFAVINAYIFKQFFVIAGAIMMFILSFVFIVRNYMLYFLIAIAPLGFLSMALPSTKKYFQQWWSNFTKWVFMPVISVFWLWLGGQFVTAVSTGYWILPVSFGILCLYMAITTPFKVGGAVLGAWGKLGKQAWSKTGGQAVKGGKWLVGGGAASYAQSYNQAKAKQAKQLGRTAIADKYQRRANIAAALNPKTYQRAIKERIAFGGAQAEKAVAKSDIYNRIVGGAKQIDVMKEVTAPDWRDASAFEAGEAAGKLVKTMQTSTSQNVADFLGQRQDEVNKLNLARQRAGMAAFTPAEEQAALVDKVMRWFRTTGSVDVENVLGTAGDPNLDRKTLAEASNIAGAWGRRSGRQFVDDREQGMLSGMASSPVPAAGVPTSPTPASGVSASPPILGPDGKPYRSTEAAGGTSESLPERDSELAGYMQELVSEFRNLEEQLGGQGSLGGEGGYDQLLGEISKMKPNLTLSDAGLAAAILPVMKVRIESMDPTALEQWGRKIRQVSEGVNKMTAGIEAENASVLRQIATVIRNGANPSKLAEGRQAIGEAADTDEGEGNG